MDISNNDLKTTEPNNNINNLLGIIDLVTDEYHNYYVVLNTTTKGLKLTEVSLSNYYYDDSYAIITEFDDETKKKYRYQHVGKILTDRLNNQIKSLKDSKRKIFTVEELLKNGTKVMFYDQTKPHPRSRS